MRARIFAAGGFGALAGACALVACSLGLDPSKIEEPGGFDALAPPADRTGPGADGAAPGADGATDASAEGGGGCVADADCPAPNACLTGRCDTARHVCLYDVCKQPQACTHAACDTTAHQCGAPAPVKFNAGAFTVPAAVGCGGVPGRCFAAVYPYVFVGTTAGVFAYPVDPGIAAPPPIPVVGMPFFPLSMVASGRRVYFVGQVGGVAPSYRVQVAWIDVPTDPLLTSIAARSVFQVTTQAAVNGLLPGPGDGVFLVDGDGKALYPTAGVDAPLADLATLSVFPIHATSTGAGPVASSGARVVTYRWTADQPPTPYAGIFSLEQAAATTDAGASNETSLYAEMGAVYGLGAIAESDEGQIVWGAPTPGDNGVGGLGTASARLAWLLSNATDTTFTAKTKVDVAGYDPTAVGFGQPVMGPLGLLDPDHVLALVQTPGALGTTTVHLAARAATDGGMTASVDPRSFAIGVSTDKLAVATTNGMGFVLAADAQASATIHIVNPACQP